MKVMIRSHFICGYVPHFLNSPNIPVVAAGISVHRKVTNKVFNLLQLHQFNLAAGNSHFLCQCLQDQLPAHEKMLGDLRSSTGVTGIV